ncbi:hypothetical protein MT340_002960 [Staphylococcus sp. NRL 16/872]|uniref:hypothetical protein n=1 Tax=Staphylococcus sp. NRL 16/872 TaxID=2930131 RepID=UPI001FB4399C|nr:MULTISPECIES: hypothetical protein [unclassified Staphylococcus]MCJ1655714.1 hypothetical protein [Staphylococcus sp. NRL 21/187]MCJ1661532.1 hypothetical protein [Staphylococcus sp. NRL 18/288]MCJ1667444.1 hypothetical protein [Staphylococcus sp. NRL 19/737]WEN69928.1 hypothetical protein MT340_002960 [Staphylococcus sp. NRL 16/872]
MPDYRNYNYEDKSNAHNNQFSRATRNGKKKRSWVSLIIHIIVLVLVGITGYSMYKQPIFNLVFVNQPINYDGIKDFQNLVTQIGSLNINFGQLANIQDIADKLILVFNVFFILCLISMVISIITILFNRTILKIINFIIIAILLVMSYYFGYAVQLIGQRISDKLQDYYLKVSPTQIISEADAIHNALILLVCSLALLIISFFFRNRRPKTKLK